MHCSGHAEGPSSRPAPCRTLGALPLLQNGLLFTPISGRIHPAPTVQPHWITTGPLLFYSDFFPLEEKIGIRNFSHCHFPPSEILPIFQGPAHCHFFHRAFPLLCGQNRALSGLLLHSLLFSEDGWHLLCIMPGVCPPQQTSESQWDPSVP